MWAIRRTEDEFYSGTSKGCRTFAGLGEAELFDDKLKLAAFMLTDVPVFLRCNPCCIDQMEDGTLRIHGTKERVRRKNNVLQLDAVLRTRLTFAQELLMRKLAEHGECALYESEILVGRNLVKKRMVETSWKRHDEIWVGWFRLTTRGKLWLQQKDAAERRKAK
jgi:hypothetical protein